MGVGGCVVGWILEASRGASEVRAGYASASDSLEAQSGDVKFRSLNVTITTVRFQKLAPVTIPQIFIVMRHQEAPWCRWLW